jgi:hypothetical protein
MRSSASRPEKRQKETPVYRALMIPKYESHHPVCLDVEWLLPTLFDASLLTFEPPLAALFLPAFRRWPIRHAPLEMPALLPPQRFSVVKVNGTLPEPGAAIGVILATSATMSVTRSRGARVCADGRHQ